MAPSARAATVTCTLEDVWLLPDITHPWDPARPMTGTFEWTYVPGDFENGSGQFTDLYIPWTARPGAGTASNRSTLLPPRLPLDIAPRR